MLALRPFGLLGACPFHGFTLAFHLLALRPFSLLGACPLHRLPLAFHLLALSPFHLLGPRLLDDPTLAFHLLALRPLGLLGTCPFHGLALPPLGLLGPRLLHDPTLAFHLLALRSLGLFRASPLLDFALTFRHFALRPLRLLGPRLFHSLSLTLHLLALRPLGLFRACVFHGFALMLRHLALPLFRRLSLRLLLDHAPGLAALGNVGSRCCGRLRIAARCALHQFAAPRFDDQPFPLRCSRGCLFSLRPRSQAALLGFRFLTASRRSHFECRRAPQLVRPVRSFCLTLRNRHRRDTGHRFRRNGPALCWSAVEHSPWRLGTSSRHLRPRRDPAFRCRTRRRRGGTQRDDLALHPVHAFTTLRKARRSGRSHGLPSQFKLRAALLAVTRGQLAGQTTGPSHHIAGCDLHPCHMAGRPLLRIPRRPDNRRMTNQAPRFNALAPGIALALPALADQSAHLHGPPQAAVHPLRIRPVADHAATRDDETCRLTALRAAQTILRGRLAEPVHHLIKAARRHEAPALGRQPPLARHAAVPGPAPQAQGFGRQRTPPDVRSTAPPCHPCRGPHIARHPHPAAAFRQGPAAVMIARPPERLVGTPCPAAVRPRPAAQRVGPPA